METTEISINGWIAKSMVCTYNYPALKKVENLVIGNNMHGPGGHYTKWNKPELEEQTLPGPIYIRNLN